jgi:hypothetical protein
VTRRERLERRAERLREWAAKRETAAAATFKAGEPFRGDIAFNTQPGHIPFRARLIAREDRAFASLKKAHGMESRAGGIEKQLERSVFSDDDDAVEKLEARIKETEKLAERCAEVNKAWRRCKGDVAAMVASGISQGLAEKAASTMRVAPWLKTPLDTTNLRAAIRRDRERIETVKKRAARAERAAAGGGVTVEGDAWVTVTFAEKPDRRVLDALRAAGFRWGGGAWFGQRERLPAEVSEMLTPPQAEEVPPAVAEALEEIAEVGAAVDASLEEEETDAEREEAEEQDRLCNEAGQREAEAARAEGLEEGDDAAP